MHLEFLITDYGLMFRKVQSDENTDNNINIVS